MPMKQPSKFKGKAIYEPSGAAYEYTMVAAILAAIAIIAMGLRPQYLVLKRCH